MYTNAKYISGPFGGPAVTIQVDTNGVTSFVPLDPANSDYAAIMRLVEAGELVVADAEAAPAQA